MRLFLRSTLIILTIITLLVSSSFAAGSVRIDATVMLVVSAPVNAKPRDLGLLVMDAWAFQYDGETPNRCYLNATASGARNSDRVSLQLQHYSCVNVHGRVISKGRIEGEGSVLGTPSVNIDGRPVVVVPAHTPATIIVTGLERPYRPTSHEK